MDVLVFIAVFLTGGGCYYYWHIHLNYNFGVITKGKVYKSGAMNPKNIESYTSKHNIKTVIDLRDEVTRYPCEEEAEAIEKINGVNYYNVRSGQIPDKKAINQFFSVMDNEDSYPVLIPGLTHQR